jgi:LacI family transcriptional regulator
MPAAPKKPTIVDVAKAAGVSVSVVSRVLMGQGYVLAAKRDKILSTMRELDYHPSPLAKGLRDRRTNTIGILFFWLRAPVLPDYYQREIIAGILDGCVTEDYQMLVNNFVGELSDLENAKYQCQRIIKDPRVEGVIVINPPLPLMEVFHKAPERCVLVNRQEAEMSFADGDQAAAMRAMVAYLAAKGNRRIGLLGGNPAKDGSDQQRRAGYREGLKAQGLDFDPELVWNGTYTFESGLEGARHLLGLRRLPTAIIASSDRMALGALDLIRQLPSSRQIAVTGFDDIPEASLESNSLTTMRQPLYEIGRAAAEIMIKREGKPSKKPVQVLLPMELILRKSA